MAQGKMKTFPKLLILFVAAVVLFKGAQFAMAKGWIPAVGIMKAMVPKRADLPNVEDAKVAGVVAVSFPSTDPAGLNQPPLRIEEWAWNAQMSLNYANGGPSTTQNSLMAKYGVNAIINRQDDTSQMQADLINCAKQLAGSAQNCTSGTNYVLIMGDGSAQFFAAINPQLKKLGSEYQAEVIGSPGYSRGEDKLMGPETWRENPQAAKGSLVAGVIRDGDWNIAQKWLADNNIPNNPDETTWDPNAMNWVNADDYLKAAEKYIAGECVDRKIVNEGRPTGQTKHVCVNGVVTWTPGDVNIAQKKGGLVSIVSSAEYRSQMPDVIIGIRKFDQDNASTVSKFLAAILEAGDQIEAFPDALNHACDISAQIYHEETGAYWCKYYKGDHETDAQGLPVDLGGSKTNNLADNLILFGLQSGSVNYFAATYHTFGDIVTQQYPKLVPSYPPVDQILNTSYLLAAKQILGTKAVTPAEMPQFTANTTTNRVVSRKNWSINFNSGQASLTPDGVQTMEQIKNDLAVASGLVVMVHGYTDNTGNSAFNYQLSKERADAVKTWLHSQAPTSFPNDRFRVFAHGDTDPVASNATPDGRAQNRRVQIVLATAN